MRTRLTRKISFPDISIEAVLSSGGFVLQCKPVLKTAFYRQHFLKKKIRLILFLNFFLCVGSLNAQWIQVASDINGVNTGDQSGQSVSISSDGSHVAIGAGLNDDNGVTSGHVRIYEEIGGAWTLIGGMSGEAAGDQAGYSVSLNSGGTRVAIGARQNNGNGTNSGHVRVFQENSGIWSQVGGDIDGEAEHDESGWSVSLSSTGTRLAIGAPFNDGNGTDAGHARVYEEIGGVWSQLGNDIDGEAAGDQSGRSVSLSSDGTRVAVGAIGNDGNGLDAGNVRVYEENGGTWTQIGSDIDGESMNDHSGWSVSLSADGSRVAIGAIGNDDNGSGSGHVRIYEENSGIWSKIGGDIDGEAAEDQSGISVSLSFDGTIVAIGASTNFGSGYRSGHIRIYHEVCGVWTQVGGDINGEAAEDRFGLSVSLSSDGTRAGVGAIFNDGNGSNSGHARVFQNTVPCNLKVGTNVPGVLNTILACMTAGDTITFDSCVFGDTLILTGPLTIDITDFALIADPAWQITVDARAFSKAFETMQGSSGIIKGVTILSGTSGTARSIDNAGSFVLSDMTLKNHPFAQPGILLSNTGSATLEGNFVVEE